MARTDKISVLGSPSEAKLIAVEESERTWGDLIICSLCENQHVGASLIHSPEPLFIPSLRSDNNRPVAEVAQIVFIAVVPIQAGPEWHALAMCISEPYFDLQMPPGALRLKPGVIIKSAVQTLQQVNVSACVIVHLQPQQG